MPAPTPEKPRRQIMIGTYRTKAEAQKAERDALTLRDQGVPLAPATSTVADAVAQYIAIRRASKRQLRTVERYESLERIMIRPHLGDRPLAKLTPLQVSSWLTLLAERGSAKGGPLAPKTVKHAFALLKSALRWAVRHDLVARNVAERVETPTVPRSRARALSEADAGRFFAEADQTGWGPFFRLAVATAARRGEIHALRWTDVDFERRTLTISRSMIETRDKSQRLVEKGTKTDRTRVVPLNEISIAALRAQQRLQEHDRALIGDSFDDTGHVFQTGFGGPVPPWVSTDRFRSIRKRLNIDATLHSLRHTGATWMIAGGTDIHTVSAVLGHSSATTTLSTYAHVVEGHERAAVDNLNATIERALEPKPTEKSDDRQKTDIAASGHEKTP